MLASVLLFLLLRWSSGLLVTMTSRLCFGERQNARRDDWADAISFDDDEEEEIWMEEEEYEVPWWVQQQLEVDANVLTRREAEVVRLRYLSSSRRRTLLEVACAMEVSLARASQLEQQAKRKLSSSSKSIPGHPYRSKRRKFEKVYGRRKKIVARRLDASLSSWSSTSRAAAEAALALKLLESRVGYFYLKDDLGLSEEVLGRIASSHGPILSQRRETLREKGQALERLTGVPASELVAKQPNLLGFSTQTIGEKVAFLKKAYQFEGWLEAPSALTCSLASLRNIESQLLEMFSPEDTVALIRSCPRLVRSKRGPVNAKILLSVMSTKALLRWPRSLLIDPDQVAARIAASRRIGINLETSPKVVSYDVDGKLRQFARVLDDDAALCESFVAKQPSLLGLSSKNLREKKKFFSQHFGDDSHRIMVKRPSALGLSLENLKSLLEWLSGKVDDPCTLVKKYPTVLGLNIQNNLEAKYRLLKAYCQDDLLLKQTLTKCPSLLGYSMANRLAPRLEAMAKRDIPFAAIAALVTLNDTAFYQKINNNNNTLLSSSSSSLQTVTRPTSTTSTTAISVSSSS